MEIPSRIFFGEEKIKNQLEELKTGKNEEQELYYFLNQAFENLKKNAFSGVQIPKNRIPKEYLIKYKITNLWKYNLPNAWRVIYSVGKEGIQVLSIILEWMNHKEYERRFNY
jgi:hypothetical protein